MASLRMQSCCFFIFALCFLASNFAQFTDILEPGWAIVHFYVRGRVVKAQAQQIFRYFFAGFSFKYYNVPAMV